MGNVTTLNYDPNGNAISNRVNGELMDVPGSAGNVRLSATAYAYDNEDRLTTTDASFFDTATQAPIGSGHAITTIAYSANSQVLTNMDANTNVTITRYDTACRVSVVTDARTNMVTYTYDANLNVIKTAEVDYSDLGSPAQTIQTTNTYDSLNRLVQTVDQLGITNRYAYDSRGDRVQTTDGRSSVIRYTYDGLNRPTATTRFLSTGGQAITSQSFDDNSRLTGQTDNNTNTTAYVYDALNRQVGTVFADGTTNGVSYDVHGNALVASDANISVVNTTYDLDNRPIAKAITRGPTVSGIGGETNQFDGLSRIVLTGNDDSLVTRSYNSLSQCLRETQQVVSSGAPARSLAFTYDGAGNCLACTYPGGRTVSYTYDRLARLQMVTNAAGLIATYNYFGPGRVERRDYGNGTRAAFSYDAIRRLTNSSHLVISSGTNVEAGAYAWDAAGNQTAMTDLLAPALDARSFSYNSLNQLTQSITAVVGPTNSYSLDHVGNRLSVTSGTNVGSYFMNPAVPPADFQMNQYSTTPFGGRTNDANGNLTVAAAEYFIYDYRNELIASYHYTGTGFNQTFGAKYDCFGRRIEKVTPLGTTRFYYQVSPGQGHENWAVAPGQGQIGSGIAVAPGQGQINGGIAVAPGQGQNHYQEIEEQDDTDATVATYVWGNGIDELLEMDRGGQRHFYHADDLGSIRKVTDNSGAVVEQYRYDDYGVPMFLNGAGTVIPETQITNATLFTGRRYDAETGNYYYRTRYLDPRVGRFTTRDTIGIWGDWAALGNGFTYVGNNPDSFVDPFGLVPGCPPGQYYDTVVNACCLNPVIIHGMAFSKSVTTAVQALLFNAIAIKQPGIKLTDYASIAIKQPGIKVTDYANVSFNPVGVGGIRGGAEQFGRPVDGGATFLHFGCTIVTWLFNDTYNDLYGTAYYHFTSDDYCTCKDKGGTYIFHDFHTPGLFEYVCPEVATWHGPHGGGPK
jgi:RHS repeat-associated protein